MYFFSKCLLLCLIIFCINNSNSKLTKFIEAKCKYIYDSILDIDGSGCLEYKDFDALIEQFGKLRGWRLSDGKYQRLVKDVCKFRDGMFQEMDPDRTGRINKTQWIDSWERFVRNNGTRCKWQKDYEDFAFHYSDVDGNGQIYMEEFMPIFLAFNTPESVVREACENAFMGKRSIDVTHFTRLWTEYYMSNDPDAPGNFLVGQTTYNHD